MRVGLTAVPFFWTEQYDFGLAYISHAERFDTVDIEGLRTIDANEWTPVSDH